MYWSARSSTVPTGLTNHRPSLRTTVTRDSDAVAGFKPRKGTKIGKLHHSLLYLTYPESSGGLKQLPSSAHRPESFVVHAVCSVTLAVSPSTVADVSSLSMVKPVLRSFPRSVSAA